MLLNFHLFYWLCARYPHHLSFFTGWIIVCLWIPFLGISTENLPTQLRQRYEPDLEPCSTCSYIFCILSKNFFPQHLLMSFKFSYLSIAPEKNISGIQQFMGDSWRKKWSKLVQKMKVDVLLKKALTHLSDWKMSIPPKIHYAKFIIVRPYILASPEERMYRKL